MPRSRFRLVPCGIPMPGLVTSTLAPALAILAAPVASGRVAEPAPKVVVLAIDLNNLHKTAPDTSFAGRLARLAEALRTRLASCGYEVIALDPVVEGEARATEGYFYEHPDVAAALAAGVGADWVIVPRLNRASAWAADLQAHVVRVSDTGEQPDRGVQGAGADAGAGRPTHRARLGLDGRSARAGDRLLPEPGPAGRAALPPLTRRGWRYPPAGGRRRSTSRSASRSAPSSVSAS